MKILLLNNEQFQAEKIIKTDKDIIGQDLIGNEVFAFRGISDFTGFTITNEDDTSTEFDIVLSDRERLSALENVLLMLM